MYLSSIECWGKLGKITTIMTLLLHFFLIWSAQDTKLY